MHEKFKFPIHIIFPRQYLYHLVYWTKSALSKLICIRKVICCCFYCAEVEFQCFQPFHSIIILIKASSENELERHYDRFCYRFQNLHHKNYLRISTCIYYINLGVWFAHKPILNYTHSKFLKGYFEIAFHQGTKFLFHTRKWNKQYVSITCFPTYPHHITLRYITSLDQREKLFYKHNSLNYFCKPNH